MPGIGIVTNPNSRRNRRFPEQMRRLGYILGEDRGRHEMTQHPDDIYEVAERFKQSEIEILALNGGDGTNHVTLSAFIKVYGDQPLPKIAFLRGGTMNTIANAIGITGTPGQIMLNISEKYHLGLPFEISPRDILSIEYDGKTVYGFIFGNGLMSNFLDVYYEGGEPTPWVAFTTFSHILGSALVGGAFAKKIFAPIDVKITADGDVWEQTSYRGLFASTIEQIGLGFRPAPRCRERAGAFHALGFTCTMLQLAASLPRIRMGRPVRNDIIRGEVLSEMLIESDGPIRFLIDGDMHVSQGPVRIGVGPRIQTIVR